jgi:hypothetical protein
VEVGEVPEGVPRSVRSLRIPEEVATDPLQLAGGPFVQRVGRGLEEALELPEGSVRPPDGESGLVKEPQPELRRHLALRLGREPGHRREAVDQPGEVEQPRSCLEGGAPLGIPDPTEGGLLGWGGSRQEGEE